jgi:hypothetical protein
MNRKQKISRLVKITHNDPDRAIQHKVYDALVADGLSEEMAATIVSNIPIMDMKDLWKKLKPKQEEPKEHEDPYGWRHSCGESFYQFDSPGDPCPSCGESGGDWEWHDEDMVKEAVEATIPVQGGTGGAPALVAAPAPAPVAADPFADLQAKVIALEAKMSASGSSPPLTSGLREELTKSIADVQHLNDRIIKIELWLTRNTAKYGSNRFVPIKRRI